MIKERLVGYIEQSIIRNWNIEALSNYREEGYSYKEIAEKILKFHIFFRETGINEGDKIALVGRNSANWCVVYLAAITYGAVIVPILPDFKPEDLINLINHSDATILFADDKIYESLDLTKTAAVNFVISLEDFSIISATKPGAKECYLSLDERLKKAYPEVICRFENSGRDDRGRRHSPRYGGLQHDVVGLPGDGAGWRGDYQDLADRAQDEASRGKLPGKNTRNDNMRARRYVAKYTINPAITHGISQYVGSLEKGKACGHRGLGAGLFRRETGDDNKGRVYCLCPDG